MSKISFEEYQAKTLAFYRNIGVATQVPNLEEFARERTEDVIAFARKQAAKMGVEVPWQEEGKTDLDLFIEWCAQTGVGYDDVSQKRGVKTLCIEPNKHNKVYASPLYKSSIYLVFVEETGRLIQMDVM